MKRIKNTDCFNTVKFALDCIRHAYEKFLSEVNFIQCTVSPR